jgi:hypothetical protein
MKLGKALATGVAEERPRTHDEELELRETIETTEEITEEAKASEEVPATR